MSGGAGTGEVSGAAGTAVMRLEAGTVDIQFDIQPGTLVDRSHVGLAQHDVHKLVVVMKVVVRRLVLERIGARYCTDRTWVEVLVGIRGNYIVEEVRIQVVEGLEELLWEYLHRLAAIV